MCGPGQKILKEGDDWIELAYEHGGRRWWQRHEIRARFVFSAQAPWESAEGALGALKEFLKSLVVG
jgi:hypothetical protein